MQKGKNCVRGSDSIWSRKIVVVPLKLTKPRDNVQPPVGPPVCKYSCHTHVVELKSGVAIERQGGEDRARMKKKKPFGANVVTPAQPIVSGDHGSWEKKGFGCHPKNRRLPKDRDVDWGAVEGT